MHRQLQLALQSSGSIVFFGGAGVSTESGIADFRSKDALEKTTAQYGHPPEEILRYSFFLENPGLFYQYLKGSLVSPSARPNAAHLALAALGQQGLLKAVVTQNIDGLHQMAGNKKVLELHGSVHRYYCMDCGTPYPPAFIHAPENCTSLDGRHTGIPYCNVCNGTIRPDVVLYEEMLDPAILEESAREISAANTLIVGGTSLAVYPAAGLIGYFQGRNLIIINKTPTPFDSQATLLIRGSIGEILGKAAGIPTP